MGDVYEDWNLTLGDDYTPTSTFRPGIVDKLDALAADSGGDAVLQFTPDGRNWLPLEGVTLPSGLFQSLTGLAQIYAPGPLGYRVKRRVKGAPATMEILRAWLR